MTGFIQAIIDAEAITEAMNEDSGFLSEMWEELATKLDMGLLLDNTCDVFGGNPNVAFALANQFESFANSLRSAVEMQGGDIDAEAIPMTNPDTTPLKDR